MDASGIQITVPPCFFKKMQIKQQTKDSVTNLALDTIKLGKQALIFVNTKRSAEKVAEEISRKIKNIEKRDLSEKILAALSKPTKQCERLGRCVAKGVAFHHSGIVAKQRSLIEDNFKNDNLLIICATPTLAMGLNMPAYRVIIRDLKRYSRHGMVWIPVLEYLQQAGRAGRPEYDVEGQAIVICNSDSEKKEVIERYIYGEPEPVYSKLAVEPVLRTYILSLITVGFVRNEPEIIDFFSRTFWAHQFHDMKELTKKIRNVLAMLEEFEFIQRKEEFVTADEIEKIRPEIMGKRVAIRPTIMGKRVAELYIDPLTANRFLKALRKATLQATIQHQAFSYLHMLCFSMEMRPLLRVKSKEWDDINEDYVKSEHLILSEEPSIYDPEYDEFMQAFKTSQMLSDWIEEASEEFLLEKYDIRPGELHSKLQIAEWLLYSSQEMCRIAKFQNLIKHISKLRTRLKYGVKEELLALLRLKNIGRVRARKLYNNKIRTIGDVKKADIGILSGILGPKVAQDVKNLVSNAKQTESKLEGC